jgi:hypothetical protein
MPGLKERGWSRITLPVAELVTMGVGAARAEDLDSIAILTRESAGEYDDEEVFE